MTLSGNIWDYFLVFASGVLVSFTPCVYPVLPLTAGFIAGMNPEGKRWMGFVLSLIYVFGLALSYSALAALAALSGKVFGVFQNSPFVYLFSSVVMILFGVMMFDLIKVPFLGVSIQDKIKIKNVWTVILFGMAAGLLVGPCTAPVLGSLLFYVASKQNILHGVSLMFFFAYGVGASLILVGTFSGLMASFPKSGKWLLIIKKSCGIIFVVVGIYLLVVGLLKTYSI